MLDILNKSAIGWYLVFQQYIQNFIFHQHSLNILHLCEFQHQARNLQSVLLQSSGNNRTGVESWIEGLSRWARQRFNLGIKRQGPRNRPSPVGAKAAARLSTESNGRWQVKYDSYIINALKQEIATVWWRYVRHIFYHLFYSVLIFFLSQHWQRAAAIRNIVWIVVYFQVPVIRPTQFSRPTSVPITQTVPVILRTA